MLQHREVHHRLVSDHANLSDKTADALRGESPSPQTAQCGKPGIIPAVHVVPRNKCSEIPFAGNHPCQIDPSEFPLPRGFFNAQFLQHPLIEGAVVLELKRA
ncbi:hypothetical protein D3C73_884600 [compost metagenome]